MSTRRSCLSALPTLLAACLLTSAGCTSREAAASVSGQPNAISVAVYDASGSSLVLRPMFIEDTKRAMAAGAPGDRFYLDLITRGDIPTYPLRFEIPATDWNEYSDNYDAKVQELVASYMQQLQGLFRSADTKGGKKKHEPRERGTDILLSIREGAKLLQAKEARVFPVRRLFIFSDMIQQSPDLDMAAADLSEKSVDRLIGELKVKGFVPDLSGVQVFIVGAGVRQVNSLSGVRRIEIERFWMRYFTVAKAVNPTRYGGSLVP